MSEQKTAAELEKLAVQLEESGDRASADVVFGMAQDARFGPMPLEIAPKPGGKG